MSGYEFLMENHLPGDTIVMFGFSYVDFFGDYVL